MQDLHQHRKSDNERNQYRMCVLSNPNFNIGSHERSTAETFYQQEISNGSDRKSSKQTYGIFKMLGIVKSKNETGNPLHQHSENKSNGDRKKNG